MASTPANQFTGSGSAYFYIAVTAQGCTENYKLTLTKPGDYYWGKFIFSGTPDFDKENVFYGYPEVLCSRQMKRQSHRTRPAMPRAAGIIPCMFPLRWATSVFRIL